MTADLSKLSACIDWLSVTGRKPIFIPDPLPAALGVEMGLLTSNIPWPGWHKTWRSPDGLAVCESGTHWQIQLSGSLCGACGAELLPWCKVLHSGGWAATRLDIAMDEMGSGLLQRPAFEAASNRGCVVNQKSFSPRADERDGQVVSDSLTWGKRGTRGTRVCLYDKGLQQETKSRGEWMRLESSFQGDSAVFAMKHLVFHGEAGVRNLAVSGIDFREPTSTHKDRRDRCSFWSKVIAASGGDTISITGRVRRTALDTFIKYVERSMMPQLLALSKKDQKGFWDWFPALLANAAPRVHHRHLVLAEKFPVILEQFYARENPGSWLETRSVRGRHGEASGLRVSERGGCGDRQDRHSARPMEVSPFLGAEVKRSDLAVRTGRGHCLGGQDANDQGCLRESTGPGVGSFGSLLARCDAGSGGQSGQVIGWEGGAADDSGVAQTAAPQKALALIAVPD